MAKRSPSSDGDDFNSVEDDCKPATSKRQRLVVFEPVRLVAVSGVNDIDQRVDRFKLVKLAERLKAQQRLLDEEKRKIERLTARQDKDDNTLCTLNRHWNRLDEDLRLILIRNGGVDDVVREDGESTSDFLGQIAQMEDDECEKVYDARVKHTLHLASRLSEADVRRAEQFASLCSDLKEFIDGGAIGISEEVVDKLAILANENQALTQNIHKLQTENRDLSLKMREKDDRIALLETKNEELVTQFEEKDFELKKSWRREEKLDTRLADLVRSQSEKSMKKDKNESNGTHSHDDTSISHSKMDSVQQELENAREILSARLEEMNELNEKCAELTAELEKAKMDLKTIPGEVIRGSEEYKNLQAFYTIMVDEAQRSKEEKEALISQLYEMKRNHANQIAQLEEEEDLSQKKLMQNCSDIEAQLNQVRKEYEQLRVEYEQAHGANEQHSVSFDNKGTVSSLHMQIQLMKSDCFKFKQKWKVAVSALSQVQRKLESERVRLQKYVLIPLNEDDIKDLGLDEVDVDGVKNSKQSIEGGDGGGPIDNGISKDQLIISKQDKEIKLLQASVNTMKISLAKLLKKDDRAKMWGDEAQRRISDLEKSLIAVKNELAEKIKEEEGLLNEMESTGQAFEELQEANGKLLNSIKEAEQQNLKVMSDRIYTVQTTNKLKEEKQTLEETAGALTNVVHAHKLEIINLKNTVKEGEERIGVLIQQHDSEYRSMRMDLDKLKRMNMNEMKKVQELRIMFDKTSTQLQEAQQAMKSKLSGHVKDEYRLRRLEEEKSILKKRVERLAKSEIIGSTDAVLLEEIKELKDVLTCPSCKVRRKDGILTKCFHVFCMDCLKTRYETRRRKCPKCNAAFGANDFHRVYIG